MFEDFNINYFKLVFIIMIDLDSIDSFKSLDGKGQLAMMTNWSNMILESFNKGKSVKIPEQVSTKSFNLNYNKDFNQIGICGMGGSGISGEFLQNYLQDVNFHIPVTLVRGYKLPKNFTSNSFIVIVSYSGNTRETLTCLHESLKRNIAVVLISSGGTCLELSEKSKIPLVLLQKSYEPRAAFPALFGAISGVFFQKFKELNFLESDLTNLTELLKKQNDLYEPNVPLKNNIAKQLAKKWLNVVPIFLSEYLCLGMRMKGQMNENSKKMAFYDTFPEMMHNTTQSWKDENLNLLPFHFVRTLIHNDTEMHDKTTYGLELAKYKSLSHVDELDFSQSNDNLLVRMFLATYLVDYASIYLAFLRNVDPSFIDIVVGMKNKFEPELTKKFDVKEALLSLF